MKLVPNPVLYIRKLSFLALAIAVKKIVSETCAKWSRIGAFSDSQGLPDITTKKIVEIKISSKKSST